MNLSLYIEKDSMMHRMNALAKLVYVIVAIAVPIIIGHWIAYTIAIICSLLLALSAKVFKQAVVVLSVVIIFLLTIIVVQALVYSKNATVLFTLFGFEFYLEGLLRARNISLNVINIVLSFSVFVLTTKPSAMTDALIQMKFPPSVAYVFSSVFQIVPQMVGTVHTISDAQKSRGMETDGNLLVRMKAFIPLISPVILNALVMTKERAIALEVRGFGGDKKKTHLYSIQNTRFEQSLIWVLLGILLITIAWRCYTWLS